MSPAVVTMRESDRVSQAVREMTAACVRHLPIVDRHDCVVGLVSSHDIVAALERGGDATLRSIMTKAVQTVGPDTPAEEAVALMIDQKFGALPVTNEDGELIGIVTATDFLVVAHQALTGAPIERLPQEM
jgi:CBS domain-containing protein